MRARDLAERGRRRRRRAHDRPAPRATSAPAAALRRRLRPRRCRSGRPSAPAAARSATASMPSARRSAPTGRRGRAARNAVCPRRSDGGSGRSRRKVEPSPGALSTAMRPPMRSTMRSRDGEAEAGAAELARRRRRRPARIRGRCAPAARARCRCRCRAPRTRSRPARRRLRRSTPTPPLSVNLMALPARLSSTWRSRAASPMTSRGQALVDVGGDLQALGLRARRQQLDDLLDQRRSARTAAASRSSLPASILEKSRISSISDSSASPEVLTALT